MCVRTMMHAGMHISMLKSTVCIYMYNCSDKALSNAHERDLVTNKNVEFRSFLGQTYLLESLFPNPVREQLEISDSGDWRILGRIEKY